MNTIYRKSTNQDIDKISKQITISYKAAYRGLMKEEYLSSLSSDHWRRILQNAELAGNNCFIAENETIIIGSAVFGKSNIEEYVEYAELFAIYLLPDYVGHGVGHKLYSEVEKSMLLQNFEGCVLEVLSKNLNAIKFYDSHGFKKIRTFTIEENGMILECVLMRKKLKERTNLG